jgi:hypothetical protein
MADSGFGRAIAEDRSREDIPIDAPCASPASVAQPRPAFLNPIAVLTRMSHCRMLCASRRSTMSEERGDDAGTIEPNYRLAWSVEGDLFLARVEGGVDEQAFRLAYWRDIVATARARDCRKLVITDRKKQRPATPAELAELTAAFRDHHDTFERVAVVEPTAAFLPAIEHAEIQARSLGINVRIFADLAAAERWARFGSADD